MKINKLSIIIPVYNEEATILEILEKVNSVKLVNKIKKEIIIVNDCSSDSTKNIIHKFLEKNPELDIKYFEHVVNKGKGAALHTGISRANGECLIIQDADLEYDPHEYNLLLNPILSDFADVVYGSRFIGGQPRRVLLIFHSFGNRFLTFMSNIFTGINITDMETCFKLFKTDILKSINLKEKRFGFEPEVTAKISRIKDIRIYEVGISYYGRTYNEGKKIGWKDGVRAIYYILKYNLFTK